jgi:hypothetical protein
MRPEATNVCGLKLLVHAQADRMQPLRPQRLVRAADEALLLQAWML